MNKTIFTINVTTRKLAFFLFVVLAIVCYLMRYTITRIMDWNSFIEFSSAEYAEPQLDAFSRVGIEYKILPSVVNGENSKSSVFIRLRDTDEAQKIVNQMWADNCIANGAPPPVLHGSMKDLLESKHSKEQL